jgi:hypothetical protein
MTGIEIILLAFGICFLASFIGWIRRKIVGRDYRSYSSSYSSSYPIIPTKLERRPMSLATMKQIHRDVMWDYKLQKSNNMPEVDIHHYLRKKYREYFENGGYI